MIDGIWLIVLFYGECIAWAARGTVDRANAWFWPIGVPIVAVVGYFRGLGTLIIPDSTPEFLLFMFVTVLTSWVAFFVIRLLLAPAKLAIDARQNAAALAVALKPKLKAYLRDGGIQTVRTALPTVPETEGPASKWVQLFVESLTQSPLVDCEVWVTHIQRIESGSSTFDLLPEPVTCKWSQTPEPQSKTRTIPPLVPQAVNFFSLYSESGKPSIYPQFDHIKLDLRDRIQAPGLYRIEAVVTAQGTTPVRKILMLNWVGHSIILKFRRHCDKIRAPLNSQPPQGQARYRRHLPRRQQKVPSPLPR
jgi:hypothetical protein